MSRLKHRTAQCAGCDHMLEWIRHKKDVLYRCWGAGSPHEGQIIDELTSRCPLHPDHGETVRSPRLSRQPKGQEITKALSRNQAEALRSIVDHIRALGVWPTVQEIKNSNALRDTSVVWRYLKAYERRNLMKRTTPVMNIPLDEQYEIDSAAIKRAIEQQKKVQCDTM